MKRDVAPFFGSRIAIFWIGEKVYYVDASTWPARYLIELNEMKSKLASELEEIQLNFLFSTPMISPGF